MPLYEYECGDCGHRFEVIQKFSDSPIERCPLCSEPVRKLLSACAIQFKGTGWYVTDYASKRNTEAAAAAAANSSDSSKTASSSDSSDSSKTASSSGSSDSSKTAPSSGSSDSGKTASASESGATKTNTKPSEK